MKFEKVYPLFLPPGPRVSIAEDVEELTDRRIHRPLARPIVRLLAPTPVTPNQVTILSGVSGVLAGVCVAASGTRPLLRVAAALLLFASAVLDCADGQLARLRGRSSPGGGALDGLADEAVGFAVILAATYISQRQYGPTTWLLGGVALISSAMQCLLFDAAKERYLARFDIPHAASKLVMAGARASGQSDSESRVTAGWLDRIFRGYVRRIQWLGGQWPDTLEDRSLARRRIRWWTTLGMGTHVAVGYVAVAISTLWPPALYLCLLVFSTVMNAELLVLILRNRGTFGSVA